MPTRSLWVWESIDSFETFYLPVADDTKLTPASLTILIDLYFMLTPNTMVEETPEVADVARMLTLTTKDVVDVLSVFQTFDPILKKKGLCRQHSLRLHERYGTNMPTTHRI